MNSLVLSKSRSVGESFTAKVTTIGTLSGVGAQVSGHRGALREPLLADWTAERFFSRVCAEMSSEVGSLSEGFAAYFTAIRLLSGVSSHVSLQSGRSGVTFATDLTDVVARLARSLAGFRIGRSLGESWTHKCR